MITKRWLCFSVVLILCYCAKAQSGSARADFLYFSQVGQAAIVDTLIINETETASENEAAAQRHSPAKAAWRSAVLPGWGQIYNRKYWKLPIVYGGLAGLGTWVGYNIYWFKQYNNALVIKQSGDSSLIDPFPFLSEATIGLRRENFRRNMDASILLTTAFYLLQITDAVVDAHLYEFDISNDLSMQVNPGLEQVAGVGALTFTPALSLNIQFKQP